MTIALVTGQYNQIKNSSVVAFPNNITPGNLVVVGIQNSNASTITAVQDENAVSAVQGAASINENSDRMAIWYFANHPGSAKTITVTWSAGPFYPCVCISEYSGAKTSGVYEGTAAANGNSASGSSGNMSPTPTTDGTLIVGHAQAASQGQAATGGFTLLGSATEIFHEYLVQGAAGAVAATFSCTSGIWMCQAASFLPAAGGLPPSLVDDGFLVGGPLVNSPMLVS